MGDVKIKMKVFFFFYLGVEKENLLMFFEVWSRELKEEREI